MRFKPIFTVHRLRVERLGQKAYDEKFHAGINIIRGDNSAGKSTVLNLLYYAIGGDISDWSPTALLCTRVIVEVSLNGNVATLARDISEKSGQPMDIFGGSIEDALIAPAANWARYPYRRSETRESFSQCLFKILDIPEASNEASGNITIHQLLRLMYADQLSPVGTIFKFEQFDPPLLRDSVGRMVFGAYENELYSNELQIRTFGKEFDEVSGELGAISKLLSVDGSILTPSWLSAERTRLEAEKEALDAKIDAAEESIYVAQNADAISLQNQKKLYLEVQEIQESIRNNTNQIDTCKFEIADAAQFIADLEIKLAALQDASATSDAFGRITFQYCPACYSSVEVLHAEHSCHLCKTPYDSERARSRIVMLMNDTSKQLRQSKSLQKDRIAELTRLVQTTKDVNSRWKIAADRLRAAARTPSSAARQELRELQRAAGYLDRELDDLRSKEKMSSALESLISRKAQLNEKITSLNERNALLKASLSKRLAGAYEEVERQILNLLHNDLPREEAFINAKTIQFEFASNKLSVDGQSYFSASSRVILRNSFFVGLLAAATIDASFRHLRLCILDSIEDKGMQPERSHNFQRMIVAASQAAKCDHQIIYATSMIAPELDIPTLTIGHYATLQRHTLDIQSAFSTRSDAT